MRNNLIKTLAFLSFANICLKAPAQEMGAEEQKLRARLLQKNDDTTNINLLMQLSEIYRQIDPDSAMSFAERALVKAKNASDLKKYPVETIGFTTGRILNNLAAQYRMTGLFPKAIEYNNRALEIWQQLERNFPANAARYKARTANTFGSLGLIFDSKADYPKALAYHLKSLKINEDLNDRKSMGSDFDHIAIVYAEQENFEEALKYLNKALKIFEDGNIRDKLASAYGNLGNIYSATDQFQKAEEAYQRALSLNREMGDSVEMSVQLGNLGVLFDTYKKFDKALNFYFAALEIDRGFRDIPSITRDLGNIGYTYMNKGDFKTAEQYFKRSLALADSSNDPEAQMADNRFLYALYDTTGRYSLAFEHYKKYVQVADLITNEENVKKQTQLEMQFDFDKKQAADSVRVSEEKKVAAAELETEKNKSYTLYGGLALVLVFAGFIFNRFRITQKQKVIIEEQKDLVEEQKKLVEEKQKEILDSIHYARRIQMAQIPSEKGVARIFSRIRR